MADNFIANAGAGGDTFAADDVSGVKYPYSKIDIGANGLSSPVNASNPMPVTGAFFQATQPVSGPLTDAALRASPVPVSGAFFQATQPVSGPLTDTQLRAAAVPVSGTFFQSTQPVSGPLTDAQLRAAAVPVSGPLTDSQLRATAVSVSGAFFQATQPVSGPLTDAELRASAVPISSEASYAEDTPHVSGAIGNLMLAIRSDSDIPTANDGDYTILKLDEEGRLKVASKPASYPTTTGNVTAVASTVPIKTTRFSNLMIHCAGTFAGVNCIFEGSLTSTNGTDGTWFAVQAIRTSANTIETTTGSLSAAPAYAWELSVNALAWFRIRATAWTSGTQVWTLVPGTYATEPIPGAQVSGTQPVSGTVTATVTAGTINPVVPATPYFLNSAASTNGALIIAGTSNVSSFYATNEGATVAYVKLYNKATAPTVGTDVMEMIIPVPAAAAGVPGVANPNIGFHGFRFALGLGIAITGAAAFSDTTAVAAGQVKVKLSRTV